MAEVAGGRGVLGQRDGAPAIELRGVSRRYGGHLTAVQDISLSVTAGELLALLGPSGCGKSTTLMLIAGLEAPDEGEVWLHGRPVARPGLFVPPEARRVGLVFQNFALFPHLSVEENVAYALADRDGGSRARRTVELLDLVGLSGAGRRYPHEISGGQQQRVAVARALANEPTTILLDESFSNLDAARRSELREELRALLRSAVVTSVFVTHDQAEALALADSLAVMHEGRILQVGRPRQVYDEPTTRIVAGLSGPASFLRGTGAGATGVCALGSIVLIEPAVGPIDILIRPETVGLKRDSQGPGVVERSIYQGPDQLIVIRLDSDERITVRVPAFATFEPGARVWPRAYRPLRAFAAGV